MRFTKVSVDLLIGKLRDAASSGSSIMEKDDGMGRPITKKQLIHFIDTLSEGFTAIRRDLDDMQEEIDRLKKRD